MSNDIDFNDLTDYLTGPNIAPINFIRFRGLLNIYNEIKIGNISIKNMEEDQKKIKSSLIEIKSGNPKIKKKNI